MLKSTTRTSVPQFIVDKILEVRAQDAFLASCDNDIPQEFDGKDAGYLMAFYFGSFVRANPIVAKRVERAFDGNNSDEDIRNILFM